jgi:hypothetical protein
VLYRKREALVTVKVAEEILAVAQVEVEQIVLV